MGGKLTFSVRVQESVHLYTTDENVNLTTSEEGNLSSSIKKKHIPWHMIQKFHFKDSIL